MVGRRAPIGQVTRRAIDTGARLIRTAVGIRSPAAGLAVRSRTVRRTPRTSTIPPRRRDEPWPGHGSSPPRRPGAPAQATDDVSGRPRPPWRSARTPARRTRRRRPPAPPGRRPRTAGRSRPDQLGDHGGQPVPPRGALVPGRPHVPGAQGRRGVHLRDGAVGPGPVDVAEPVQQRGTAHGGESDPVGRDAQRGAPGQRTAAASRTGSRSRSCLRCGRRRSGSRPTGRARAARWPTRGSSRWCRPRCGRAGSRGRSRPSAQPEDAGW